MNKEGWTYKKLGEICEVLTGSTPKTSVPEYWGVGNYWVTPAELDDHVYINSTERSITNKALEHSKMKLMPKGTVLLTSRAPIGKVAIAGVPMYCNQGFKNLVCSDVIYNKYLYWFLKIKKEFLNSLGRGATFKEISKTIVENIQILLPPLPVQHRIVSELDQLSDIIAMKRKQVEEYDALSQSVFYEMFGSEIASANKENFNQCFKLNSGDSLPARNIQAGPYPVYGGNGVMGYHNNFNLDGNNIIIGRVGALCGNVRLVQGKIFVSDNAFILTDKRGYDLCFLSYYLKILNLRHYAREAMQPVISNLSLKNIKICFPPLPLQHAFADKVRAIERQKQLANDSIRELQTLLDSRMQEYFG